MKQRGTGSDKWETFPATLCMTEYLDGKATVDELNFPTKGWAGLTVRTFDVKKRQWSIYWVSSATGVMGAPVIGGFDGKHGEFYGEDSDNGRPVAVRFIWDKLDRNPTKATTGSHGAERHAAGKASCDRRRVTRSVIIVIQSRTEQET